MDLTNDCYEAFDDVENESSSELGKDTQETESRRQSSRKSKRIPMKLISTKDLVDMLFLGDSRGMVRPHLKTLAKVNIKYKVTTTVICSCGNGDCDLSIRIGRCAPLGKGRWRCFHCNHYFTSSTTTAISTPPHFSLSPTWEGSWTLGNVENGGVCLLNSYLAKNVYRMRLHTPLTMQYTHWWTRVLSSLGALHAEARFRIKIGIIISLFVIQRKECR